MAQACLFALLPVFVAQADLPWLQIESSIVPEEAQTIDVKVSVVNTLESPLEPLFIIGVGWDPVLVDLLEVNFDGTVFEEAPPELWDPIACLNLKPDGEPVAGIYNPLCGDPAPCTTRVGPFEAQPILNLRFARLEAFGPSVRTAVRFVKPPPPATNPDLDVENALLVQGEWTPAGTTDGALVTRGAVHYRRGDCNDDGVVDMSDAIRDFWWLFMCLGCFEIVCMDACDTNADGEVNITDPIFTLNWLFLGGTEPPSPGPFTCGEAGVNIYQEIGCTRYTGC